jgi:dienelactone hydrolase
MMFRLRSAALALVAMIVLHGPADAAVQKTVAIRTTAAGRLAGTFYFPESAGPVPAVLVLHTAGGLSETDRIYARRLAESGYAALVVSYRVGWVAPTNHALAEAVDWLRKQPQSRDMPVAVIGFSLGASKALLIAALRPRAVKAVVSYYGTYDVRISKFASRVQRAHAMTGMGTPSPVQVADQLGGAVLLLQGGDDEETSPAQTARMKRALESAGKTYKLVVYPGAVHMFEREPKYHPPGLRTKFGTRTGYDPAAAKASWDETLRWLKQYLRSS